MVTTRSMTRKDWSRFDHDLLLLIMMRLGLVDFIAFSGVCKSWRSLVVSNWNKFMVSKQPMPLSISTRLLKKECYIEDYSRRKLKTTIRHSNGGICVGITCGYLIFFGIKTRDFWLVNPFTSQELHFPGFPYTACPIQEQIKGILVFSPLMSGWVLVILAVRFSSYLAFSLAGKQAKWRHIYSDSSIDDLHFFKGKMYTLNAGNLLYELRLNPVPTLSLLKMKNLPSSNIRYLEFVSSGEKLYVTRNTRYEFDAIEVNLDEMEWMNTENTIGEYAVFLSDLKCNAAIKPDTWAHPWTQYERLNYADGGDRIKKDEWFLTSYMWYFPHDCLIDNNNDMKNRALLNVLEEGDEKKSNRMSCKVHVGNKQPCERMTSFLYVERRLLPFMSHLRY